MKRLDADRKEALERLLKAIFSSLRKTHELVQYFKSLGNDEEGLQVWKRMKWLHKRGEILQLRKQISAESTRIQLCMSDINNASLARIEASIEEALNKQELELEDDEVTPLVNARSSSSNPRDPDLSGTTMPRRRHTERTLGEKTLVSTMDYPSSASGDSEGNLPLPKGQCRLSSPNKTTRRQPSLPIGINAPPSPFSDDGVSMKDRRASDNKGSPHETYNKGLLIDIQSRQGDYYRNTTPETSVMEPEADFIAVIDLAKEELFRVRQEERQAKPLRVPDRSLFPEAGPKLKTEFEQSLKSEMEYRQLNTRDWLRIGTWWLLKATFRLEALEKADTNVQQGRLSKVVRSSLPYVQSYVDLLKSTWILFECILKSDYVIPMHSDENRKLFKDLEDVSLLPFTFLTF